MSYTQQYTELDGAWHAIAEDEHTYSGLPIPHGNGYSLLPDKVKAHCGPDTKVEEPVVEEVVEEPAEPVKPAKKARKVA